MRALALLLVSTMGLAACGFTPVYGSGGPVGSALTRVSITTTDDRLGYRVREQLEDALGRDAGQTPQWRLDTRVEQARRPLGLRLDDTASRYELTVRAAWTLTPTSGARPPLTGTNTVVTTYASADQPFAAIAAQEDGEERAAAELARQIRLDLIRALSE